MEITHVGIVDHNYSNEPPPRDEEVQLVKTFIRRFLKRHPEGKVDRRISSIRLKGWAEKWLGEYISNGAFILAMVEEGFRVERRGRGPDAYFDIERPYELERFVREYGSDSLRIIGPHRDQRWGDEE